MTLEYELRQVADELRAIAQVGLHWTKDDPYNRDRYERIRGAAARLFAMADTRDVDEIEPSLFEQLTHIAPLPVGEGAVFDEEGRILLIRRADDGLWAMPGGGFDVGETPAQGAAREVREETGVEVDVVDLIGVYDSRFCETISSLQLYMFVFLCQAVGTTEPSTPHEVTDVGWFARGDLPRLSPGHTIRVPDAFRFLSDRRTFFDPP